ncbi:MAG: nucleotide exchange factor GrpE [Candidatus Omnitrophota bacterium]|nr:MAG: nucleotide exchange factor GrpE [Candidatus Omnitrophota bacterium]
MADWSDAVKKKGSIIRRAAAGGGMKPDLVADLKDKYFRALDEMSSMRKRFQRSLDEQRIREQMVVFRELLPVLDSLERAIQAEMRESNAWLEGVRQTDALFRKKLEQFDVQPTPGVGEPFDPNVHEAVDTVTGPIHRDGTIHAVHEQGYVLNGRLIRPAKVVVVKTV